MVGEWCVARLPVFFPRTLHLQARSSSCGGQRDGHHSPPIFPLFHSWFCSSSHRESFWLSSHIERFCFLFHHWGSPLWSCLGHLVHAGVCSVLPSLADCYSGFCSSSRCHREYFLPSLIIGLCKPFTLGGYGCVGYPHGLWSTYLFSLVQD